MTTWWLFFNKNFMVYPHLSPVLSPNSQMPAFTIVDHGLWKLHQPPETRQ